MRENGSRSCTAIGEENNEPRQVMANMVEDYVEEAEHKWKKGPKAWTTFCMGNDLFLLGLQQYLLQDRSVNRAVIPIVNVLHSMWSQVDITMNG